MGDKNAGTDGDTIRGLPCFSLGQHRPDGYDYGPRDLADMVRNFRLYQSGPRPLMVPPVVIGHGEGQEWLKDSGLPAAAWMTGLARRGDDLDCDLDKVAPLLRELVRQGRYRFVSLEVYTPDALPRAFKEAGARGCMVRRLAVLGAMPPEIKGLGDLSLERFSERPRRHTRFDARRPALLSCGLRGMIPLPGGVWACFSEVTEMDRAALLERLTAKGVDTSVIDDSIPDAALAEWLRSIDGAGEAAEETVPEGAPAGPAPDTTEDMGDIGGEPAPEDAPPPEEMGEGEWEEGEGERYKKGPEGSEFHEPVNEEAAVGMHKHACKYAEHAKMHLAKFSSKKGGLAAKYAEALPEYTMGLVKEGDADKPAEKPAPVKEDKKPETYSELLAEVRKTVASEMNKQAKKTLGEVEKHSEQIRRVSDEAAIEKLSSAGKVSPAERGRCLRILASLSPAVEKFSEGGREVSISPKDDYLASLAKRPSLFRELAGTSGHDADGDVAEIEGHWESHAEVFGKIGTTKADLVKHFEEARRADPRLTARTHLLTMAGRRA